MGGGGVVQNRESPDFRSPEVGRYVFDCVDTNQANKNYHKQSILFAASIATNEI